VLQTATPATPAQLVAPTEKVGWLYKRGGAGGSKLAKSSHLAASPREGTAAAFTLAEGALFATKTLFAWREEAAEGDLVFDEDMIISVMATDGDSGWWTGRIGGIEGIFPANYVERVEEASLNLEPAGGDTAGRAGGLKGKVGHRASWKKRCEPRTWLARTVIILVYL